MVSKCFHAYIISSKICDSGNNVGKEEQKMTCRMQNLLIFKKGSDRNLEGSFVPVVDVPYTDVVVGLSKDLMINKPDDLQIQYVFKTI